MTQKNFIYPFLFVMVALLSSCSSTKRITKNVNIGNLSQKEYVGKIIENGKKYDAISAKSVFTLTLGNKDPFSVSGSMKIKKGEAIILSATPLLGIEVARIEITPSGILVLDRMKKRYVKATFSELNAHLNNNLDYNSLEALFLNSIFIPGISNISSNNDDRFNVSVDADNVIMNVNGLKQLDYNFITNSTTGQLIESDIMVKDTPYKMKWKYDNFKTLDNGEFPSNMNVNIDGIKKNISLEIELSRLSDSSDWQPTKDIPQRYQKVGMEDIIKILAK